MSTCSFKGKRVLVFLLALATGAGVLPASSSARHESSLDLRLAPVSSAYPRSSAQRSSLPSARTGKALSVGRTSAILTGAVNAHDLPTRFKFQFGSTRPYSTTTETGEEDVVGHRTEIVAEAVIHLRPGTIYHYRLIAFNRHGFVVGKDRELKTLG
jgi:hypothetical protein